VTWVRLLLTLAFALPASTRLGDDVSLALNVRSVPLDPTNPSRRHLGSLRYRGGLVLRSGDPRFGGLSDLRVLENGRRLVAVSDCGTAFLAGLTYDERGDLRGLDDARLRPLMAPGGRPLTEGEEDAESLALAPDDAFVVGFERRHRLWRYSPGRDPFSLPPEPLPIPPASVNLEPNQGFEAALFLADARLVLLSEANTGPETASGWVGNDRAWDAFSFPLFYLDDAPREPFRPTALAALPGGDVLVLERRYPPLAVRVRRLPGTAFGRTWDLAGTELARLAPPLTVDNFEGLDVAPGPDGELRLFLISDDNDCAKGGHRHGTSDQRTLLLSFSMFD